LFAAVGTEPDEDDVMAADRVTRGSLDACGGIVDDAVAHLGDPAARLAADVLMVAVLQLVPRRPIAEVKAVDDSGLLEGADRPEDRRVVGAGHPTSDAVEELAKRPRMSLP
jgi:hypothetical protein